MLSQDFNIDDYQSLVCTFNVKEEEIVKLSDAKNDVNRCLQESFQEFVQAQSERDDAEQKSKISHFTLEQERKTLKTLQDEKTFWDKRLESKQKEVQELKEVLSKDSAEFKKNCELMCAEHKKLDKELDNETLSKEIARITSNKKELEERIQEVELELQRVSNLPNQEFTRIPGLTQLTETFEKESVEMFGKPHELKKKLKELQQNTKYLKEQIQKMEQ